MFTSKNTTGRLNRLRLAAELCCVRSLSVTHSCYLLISSLCNHVFIRFLLTSIFIHALFGSARKTGLAQCCQSFGSPMVKLGPAPELTNSITWHKHLPSISRLRHWSLKSCNPSTAWAVHGTERACRGDVAYEMRNYNLSPGCDNYNYLRQAE